MQNPVDFFLSVKTGHTKQSLNILREYLQVMALQILYSMKDSECLRFGGGTCLRICYDLPRYSEDLDFSLDKKGFDVTALISQLHKGFQQYNTDFELSVPKNTDEKRIAKYWLKFPQLLHQLKYSPHPSEKLAIKFEVDKHPPKKGNGEYFYVTKFNQYFPIFKNDLPTLFAGKIGAVCHRSYHAMRDYYDILWYLNKGIEPNYAELKEIDVPVKDRPGLVNLLSKKTKNMDGIKLISDLENLLEHSEEKKVLKNYPVAFKQASDRFLESV